MRKAREINYQLSILKFSFDLPPLIASTYI